MSYLQNGTLIEVTYSGIYTGILRYTQVHSGILRYTQVYSGTLRCTQVDMVDATHTYTINMIPNSQGGSSRGFSGFRGLLLVTMVTRWGCDNASQDRGGYSCLCTGVTGCLATSR